MTTKNRKIILAALALVSAAAFFWSLHPFDWPTYHQLEESGKGTMGWVTGKDPAAGMVYYSFSISEGGRVYNGKGRAWGGSEALETLSNGDRIFVSYLPSDPSVSIPDDPKNFLRPQNALLTWLLLLVFATFLWFLFANLRK